MVNKFHYLALFVWCVFLSCISASGDAEMCEEDDAETGKELCIVHGVLLWVQNIPHPNEELVCSWVGEDWETKRLECMFVNTPFTPTFGWQPYTFFVFAETDQERMDRLARDADKHIVATVTSWYYACDQEEGPVIIGATGHRFTMDDCDKIKEFFDAGFAEPVTTIAEYGPLKGFEAVDDNSKERKTSSGWFTPYPYGRGKITINIGVIERNNFGRYKDWEIKGVVAHERIHLADWRNSTWDWIEGGSLANHHDPTRDKKNDETYVWGEFIRDEAAALDMDWGRGCRADRGAVLKYIEGWGPYEFPDGFCIFETVLQRAR